MKIFWYLRQLLPFTYRSKYKTSDGKRHFAVWKMFLGNCYDYEDFVLGVDSE